MRQENNKGMKGCVGLTTRPRSTGWRGFIPPFCYTYLEVLRGEQKIVSMMKGIIVYLKERFHAKEILMKLRRGERYDAKGV